MRQMTHVGFLIIFAISQQGSSQIMTESCPWTAVENVYKIWPKSKGDFIDKYQAKMYKQEIKDIYSCN